jgi:hypothetical protein
VVHRSRYARFSAAGRVDQVDRAAHLRRPATEGRQRGDHAREDALDLVATEQVDAFAMVEGEAKSLTSAVPEYAARLSVVLGEADQRGHLQALNPDEAGDGDLLEPSERDRLRAGLLRKRLA